MIPFYLRSQPSLPDQTLDGRLDLASRVFAQFAGNLRARIEASPAAMQKEISLAALAGRALVAQFKKT